jgi:hypothetical protein
MGAGLQIPNTAYRRKAKGAPVNRRALAKIGF